MTHTMETLAETSTTTHWWEQVMRDTSAASRWWDQGVWETSTVNKQVIFIRVYVYVLEPRSCQRKT